MSEYHTPEYLFVVTPVEREAWDELWQQPTTQIIGWNCSVSIKREGRRYWLTADERERLREMGPTDEFVDTLGKREPDEFFIPEGAVIRSITFELPR